MAKANEVVEKVEKILLSEIHFDYKWNCRSNVEAGSGGPEGGDGSDDGKGGFAGLCASIAQRGQDEAIIVRPAEKGARKPYLAVTGFRRGAAIAKLAADAGNKAPTINAIIRPMNEAQALELNVSENAVRDDLSGPDLAFGIHAMAKANPILNSTDISKRLGLGQGYVHKLMAIMANCTEKVTADWRESPRKLTTEQMVAVSKVEGKQAQEAKYQEMKDKKGDNGAAKGKYAWVENTKKNFAKWGKVFGELVKRGQLSFTNSELFFDVTTDNEGGIVEFQSVKKEATDAQRSMFTQAALDAYDAAVDGVAADEAPANGKKLKSGMKGDAPAVAS